MTPKARIMDEIAISRAMARISHEIIERNQGIEDVCIFGVKRCGVPLAQCFVIILRSSGIQKCPVVVWM